MEEKENLSLRVAGVNLLVTNNSLDIAGGVNKMLCQVIGKELNPEDPDAFYNEIRQATKEYAEKLQKIGKDLPTIAGSEVIANGLGVGTETGDIKA